MSRPSLGARASVRHPPAMHAAMSGQQTCTHCSASWPGCSAEGSQELPAPAPAAGPNPLSLLLGSLVGCTQVGARDAWAQACCQGAACGAGHWAHSAECSARSPSRLLPVTRALPQRQYTSTMIAKEMQLGDMGAVAWTATGAAPRRGGALHRVGARPAACACSPRLPCSCWSPPWHHRWDISSASAPAPCTHRSPARRAGEYDLRGVRGGEPGVDARFRRVRLEGTADGPLSQADLDRIAEQVQGGAWGAHRDPAGRGCEWGDRKSVV